MVKASTWGRCVGMEECHPRSKVPEYESVLAAGSVVGGDGKEILFF